MFQELGKNWESIQSEDDVLLSDTDDTDDTVEEWVFIVHWRLACRKEGNVLFNDALNTFYLQLYGFRHMVKDHSDRERGNLLPPHGLLFPINSKGSFISTIPQTG